MLEEDLATIEKNYDLEQIKEIIKITKDNLNNYNKKY